MVIGKPSRAAVLVNLGGFEPTFETSEEMRLSRNVRAEDCRLRKESVHAFHRTRHSENVSSLVGRSRATCEEHQRGAYAFLSERLGEEPHQVVGLFGLRSLMVERS